MYQLKAVRCRTEDGPSAEDVKKVIRTCMNKLSDEQNGSDHGSRDYSDEDDDDNEYDDNNDNHKRNNSHNNKQSNKGNNNRRNFSYQQLGTRIKRETKPNGMPLHPHDNNDFQWRNQQQTHSEHSDRNSNKDKSCIVQCFFQEMKMVCMKYYKKFLL